MSASKQEPVKAPSRELPPVILGTRRQIQLARERDWVEVLGWFAILIPTLFFIANRGLHSLDTLPGIAMVLNRISALIGTSRRSRAGRGAASVGT